METTRRKEMEQQPTKAIYFFLGCTSISPRSNIPEKKSVLVKQILKGLGVTIQQEPHIETSSYKQKLAKVSAWTDDDLKVVEESKKAFENLKPQQW